MTAPAPIAPPARLLLIHFSQLGDAVMALPAAHALRRHYPQAELTVLTSRGGDAIYRMAGFDPVLTADRVRWKRAPWTLLRDLPRLALDLRRRKFDLSVDLHSFKETNALAWAVRIPQRVAMLRPTRSWPRLITHKPPPDETLGRLLDRYCTVLAPLGIEVQPADRIPRLAPDPQITADIARTFKSWAGTSPILGICPGAGHPGRRWPADRFAAVARELQSRHDLYVAVFAGPEETEAQLAPFESQPQCKIWRHLTIPELAAALAQCRVVISGPTGPSHIAAAVGTRLLTLGEIPPFDPVPQVAGEVVPLRVPQVISDLTPADVQAPLEDLWSAPSLRSLTPNP